MSRKVKQFMVQEMADRFSDLDEHGCVLVGYQGIGANKSAQLRGQLAEDGADMMVVRNRLFRIALDELGISEMKNLVDGPTAVVTAEDPVQAAKAVDEAAEVAPALAVLGGYAEGEVLDPAGVEKLADLPDRDTLLSQVLAGMSAPAQQFVNCLNGTAMRLASVLNQIKEKKEEEEG
mgnify:CR=1 FL=1